MMDLKLNLTETGMKSGNESGNLGWLNAGVVNNLGQLADSLGSVAGLGYSSHSWQNPELKGTGNASYDWSGRLKTRRIALSSPFWSSSPHIPLSYTTPLIKPRPTPLHASAKGSLEADVTTTPAPNPSNPILKPSSELALRSADSLKFDGSHLIKDFSKLNHSNPNELERHRHLLSPQQLNLLHSVRRKQEIYPLRYRDDYLRHSSILLLANGWSSAMRYSLCSVPNSLNRSGQCKLHKFCPYCSFLARSQALARYVPVYESGAWHFLTLSFEGDLLMNDASDYFTLTDYWDGLKAGLRELVGLKLIRGAFWTEELAVNSIAPVHVLPHSHALIEADCVNDEALAKLRESVSRNLKAVVGPDHLNLNLHLKPLNSQRTLLSHLQYQIKPIQIVKPYDLAWYRNVDTERNGAVEINSQTTDLILGYSCATKRRNKINYAGNLSPKTKAFIGTKPKEMKDARRVVSEVMELGVEYVDMDEAGQTTATTE